MNKIFGKDSVFNIEFQTKLRILTNVSFIFSAVTFIVVVIRVFKYNSYSIPTFTSLAAVVIFGALGIYLKKTSNLKVGVILFQVSALIIAPIRIYQTGGIDSPAILSIYAAHTLISYSVNSKKVGHLILCWNLLSIVAFLFQETKTIEFVSPFSQSDFGVALAMVLGLIFIVMPMSFILKQKDILTRKLRKFERQEAANIIMKRLAHEFGNAINISLNNLQILKTDKELDQHYIDLASKSLKEMDQIIKGFIRISDERDLILFLEKSEKELKIINRLPDDINNPSG